MSFQLLGMDNAYGRYPAPVVPIGKLNGVLVAVYPGSETCDDRIPEDASYVPFSDQQRLALYDFNHLSERLFAIKADHVVRYHINDEGEFFAGLLLNPKFSKNDPEMRRILQRSIDGGEPVRA